jgi:hypothetical protein
MEIGSQAEIEQAEYWLTGGQTAVEKRPTGDRVTDGR